MVALPQPCIGFIKYCKVARNDKSEQSYGLRNPGIRPSVQSKRNDLAGGATLGDSHFIHKLRVG
jgi:hypothetical protein